MAPDHSHERPEWQCRYRGAICPKPRDTKLNGELHSLCEEHRRRANRNQRRLQQRQRLARAKDASNKARANLRTSISRPRAHQEVSPGIHPLPFDEWQLLVDNLDIHGSLLNVTSSTTPAVDSSLFPPLHDEGNRFQFFSYPETMFFDQENQQPFAEFGSQVHNFLPPRR